MSERSTIAAHVLALFPLAEIDRTNNLLADYLVSAANARDLFTRDPDDMVEVAQQARAQADRPRLSDVLTGFQRYLGADDAAIASAKLLADPATPVITTGQQSGLLTGPLYTIYKAISTINVANRVAETLGRPVVPVFWAATDDDDRDEADHCGCWDQQFGLHGIRYPEAGGEPGALIGNLPVACYGEQVLQQIEPLIEGLPYAGEVCETLRGTLAASHDMGEWFCRLMAHLFSPLGLVICDPRLPEMRALSVEIIRREIAAPLASTVQVNQRAHELRRRGYRPQLTKPAEVCNFFLLSEQRERVTFRDDHFHVEGQGYTPDALLQLAQQEPTRFTPNAVLRPVVQEYLLGSTAFITGPNELGYWAELAPVFASLNVEMPPVIPRAAATLVPSGVARYLHQWTINPLDILFDYDTVRFSLLARQQPEQVSQGFAQSRAQIEHVIAHLSEVVADVDETLMQSALATHQRMLNELERLEKKTLKAIERHSTEQTERLERLRKTLFPRHGLQERTLNVFSLLARYGPDVLNQLRILLDREEGRHVFVEL